MSNHQRADKKNLFARAILPACISAVVFSAATVQVNAQEEVKKKLELPELEEVVVTGTRREGVAPTETLSPIDVLSGDLVGNQAAFDLTDSLSKLSPSLNTQRFPIADGTAFIRPVTLRNLAPDQTLVLVNGTRRHRSALVNLQLAPLGDVNQGSQAVDFGAIPAAAIKRVEVLRDGASAQYGSDAIAGVVNVILNDADEGISISTQYGEYSEDDDGERFSLSANAGFKLGEEGFLNITLERSTSDITSRGVQHFRADVVDDFVPSNQIPYDGLGQRWGDPDVETNKFFVNAAIPLNEHVELYGNASYMEGESEGGFFYRHPVLDPAAGLVAHDSLQVDANEDFIPDDAPLSLVNDILADGLNPADYLVADAGSPSGYVLQNPIASQFPGGYGPLLGADINDYAVVLGARGDLDNGLSWDVTVRYAENEVEYSLENTINPSLGVNSPTSFAPGDLTQEESSFNADFVKTFDDSPVNLAFGFEWRNETYSIGAGDQASVEQGPTYAQFGVGSNGFQGFDPAAAGEWESDSYAAYIDVETDITDRFSAAIALRFEEYEEFDSTVDWKLSGRYEFTDQFAMRATANTGFRAPTPGQVNTLNGTTSADSTGKLIPNFTYPVHHPIAQALGAEELTSEESESYTLGLVYQPLDNLSITLDYYHIEIDDRIALQADAVEASDVPALINQGIAPADAALLVDSLAGYFVNGFDSEVEGIDLAVTADFIVGEGMLTTDLRYNHNEQEISGVKSGAINGDRIYDLENYVPEDRAILTFTYAQDIFDSYVRVNYYGDWGATGGIFGNGDASDAVDYGSATTVDLEASLTFDDKYTVAIGGDNVFDEYPDDEGNVVAGLIGAKYALTSPFGFNGAFWYVRASANF